MSKDRRSAATEGGFAPVGVFVARHRKSRVIRKVARLCQRYLSWYGNVSYDLRSNGESFILQTLARFEPKVLFDVGANVGGWSLEAVARCPAAQIHAFEIAGPTFAQLLENTADFPNVRCRLAGMSDSEGSTRIRYYDALPSLTTSLPYPHPLPYSELDATVTTGDKYCAEHGIAHIDLVKIDVEGMERQVLNGLKDMFARNAIDLVQFEYGRANILNEFLLRDFHAFFEQRGYVVGKLYPNYVDFRGYDLADEDFAGPNFLACRSDKVHYLRAFGGGPNGHFASRR